MVVFTPYFHVFQVSDCEESSEDEFENRRTSNKRHPQHLADVTNASTPKRPCYSKSQQEASQLAAIMSALGENKQLLCDVVERMDKHEGRMEHIESRLNSSVSSSSSSTPVRSRQKIVPLPVRVSILCGGGGGGGGDYCRFSKKGGRNQSTTVKFVSWYSSSVPTRVLCSLHSPLFFLTPPPLLPRPSHHPLSYLMPHPTTSLTSPHPLLTPLTPTIKTLYVF